MITDPLHPDLVHAAQGRLSRGFSHRSKSHVAVPFLSCVGHVPVASRLASGPASKHSTYGMRLSLTLSHEVS
jgi:hypothetical protein